MRTVRFSIGLIALAIVASAVVPAYAAPAAVGPVADTRFGIAEGFRNPSVMDDLGAGWELRLGPGNRFRVFYRVDIERQQVRTLAIAVKERNRLFLGGEEVEL